MLNTNFIITLITVLTALFCLFQGEIKEGFINAPIVVPPNYPKDVQGESKLFNFQPFTPEVLGNEPYNGTVNNGFFSAWSASSAFTPVKYDVTKDVITGEPLNKTKPKLGYNLNKALTGKHRKQPANDPICRENFSQSQNANIPNSGVMVEAKRNMQPVGSAPPRFMVTGPKLNHYSPINQARYAVDNKNSIVNYGCNDVFANGQMLKGQCQKQNTREDYQDQSLPSDMTNTCLVGGPDVSLAGQPSQPVMIDRAMWSNIKSRYQRVGVDRFRGDLQIAPHSLTNNCSNIFQTSVSPVIDLATGYISQHNIAGKENARSTAALGLQCNLMDSEGNGNLGGYSGSSSSTQFGGGNPPPQGAYSRCVNVTFGTDIDVDVGDGVM
jgi:hypothetical protein